MSLMTDLVGNKASRAMLKRCDGSMPSLRWPIQCPAVLYTHGFTDKVHPHRVRGVAMKCHSGRWTRRGALMRVRREGR